MLHAVTGERASVKDLKRRLEAARQAVEAIDADLAVGTLDSETHGRERAEREREVGRLFVALRRAQRDVAGAVEHEAAPAAVARPAWTRNPFVITAVGFVLLAAGIAGGVAIARWGVSGPIPQTVAPAADTSGMTPVELQALRQAASREDAPIGGLLQLAHAELDAGRVGEARRLYERVLAREPRNVEAITHVGAVLYQEGQMDAALGKVDEALRIDPRYVHAHWDRVQYLFHGKRDFPAAVKAAEAFLQVVPDGPDAEQIRKLMAEARAQSKR